MLIFESHTLPSFYSDVFWKPPLEDSYTIVWSVGEGVGFSCLHFLRYFSKRSNCYWLETVDFSNSTKNTEKFIADNSPVLFQHTISPTGTKIPILRQFEVLTLKILSVENPQFFKQTNIPTGLPLIEMALIWILEFRTPWSRMKNHHSLKFQSFHHYSIYLRLVSRIGWFK